MFCVNTVPGTCFATLVASGPDGLLANHIPMLLAPDDRLIGHVAAANEIYRVIGEIAAVLAVFSGEDGYASPNWYPGKAAHQRVVPTWNYRVVHVHGRISFIHDPKSNAPSSAGSRRASNAR